MRTIVLASFFVILSSAIIATEATYGYNQPGIPGPPGPRGPPGPPGRRGPKGDMGFPGSDGEAGLPGRKGDRGPHGVPGRGPMGAPGEPGFPGQKGVMGDTGDHGADGPPGDRGSARCDEPGHPGFKGREGNKGDKGNRGPPGKNGVSGDLFIYWGRNNCVGDSGGLELIHSGVALVDPQGNALCMPLACNIGSSPVCSSFERNLPTDEAEKIETLQAQNLVEVAFPEEDFQTAEGLNCSLCADPQASRVLTINSANVCPPNFSPMYKGFLAGISETKSNSLLCVQEPDPNINTPREPVTEYKSLAKILTTCLPENPGDCDPFNGAAVGVPCVVCSYRPRPVNV